MSSLSATVHHDDRQFARSFNSSFSQMTEKSRQDALISVSRGRKAINES